MAHLIERKTAMNYAELHCKTNFSFLEGASFADELVAQAHALGLKALGITDRNTLAGVVRAHIAAKEIGLRLLIGAEIVPEDAPPVLLYPTDRLAYGRLARLITLGSRRAEKGQCRLTLQDVAEHAQGQIAIAIPPRDICAFRKWTDQTPILLKDAFGPRLYTAIELHLGPHDAERREKLSAFSRNHDVPLVAANDVHYHVIQRRMLQDVLVCIREGCTLETAGRRLFSNAERRLKSADELQSVLGPSSEAWLERTSEIADACQFSLDELRYEYPEELVPSGRTPMAYLTELSWIGAQKRWPDGTPDTVRHQIEHELNLIADMKYEAFFLTVHDIVRFARSRGILSQGRGSAANSAVCYCLGITSVDPARSNVLFERFISKERGEAPDIDVDFEHERREEVMQYVYEKYGRERAGLVAEVISYRPKSATRDVGKALGLSVDSVEKIAEVMDRFDESDKMALRLKDAGLDLNERTMRQFLGLTREILGFPRHLSQHVGGFVITRGPLCELVPIENARMEARTVIQWDKDDIDALGILKVDCLALGMLTCIRKGFDLLRQHGGPDLTLATVPPEDTGVYDMCCRADTIGVFQIESRAQMSMLPRLKPKTFYDLVIEVSIVRPGPIQGGMVHPYLRRRAGEEAVTFPREALREVLGQTLGVPLFQEQVMRLAVVAAGFTPGEADQLRRSMAAWRRSGQIDAHHKKFIAGMLKNGYDESFAENTFEQIRGFGSYGFPESHAASFALLVYASAWLKCYHPAIFTTALLNSQPMGFYAPAQLIRDAQNHGIAILPVDINHSRWECTLVDMHTIRLGLQHVKGLSQRDDAEPILRARHAPFVSIRDVARRTGLTPASLSLLAGADAFRSLEMDRRDSFWQVLAEHNELPLFKGMDAEESAPQLPAMPLQEHVSQDYQRTGLSLKAHPISFIRAELDRMGIAACQTLKSLRDGARVRVAGIVLVRQRPETASGVVFVTLEDETSTANIILWPTVFNRFRKAARTAAGLIIEGKLQIQGDVVHVVAQRVDDLAELSPALQRQSRDFH
jgi:error-prone DNA polymerase